MSWRLCILMLLAFQPGCGNSPTTPDLSWGKRGLREGDFIRPRAITIGTNAAGQEEIYIVDFAGRIQAFDMQGKPLRLWKSPSIENGRPAGLGWSKKRKQLIVADSHYQQILMYSPDGELKQTIKGTQGEKNLGPFQYVADVAEDEAGNLYVSEFGNENEDRIRKLSPEGNHVASWGSHGSGPGEFSRPRGLAFNDKGELHVTDSCNHRIQVFDRLGKLLRIIGKNGNGPGELQYPYDVALGPKGDVYVSEWGQNRMQKFTSEGVSLSTWGHAGRDAGGLHQPWGIAVSNSSRAYFLDTENHRVQSVPW